ncbi:MAG: enoyl-CoA hydratase-related protein [Burkholderiales bacterium]
MSTEPVIVTRDDSGEIATVALNNPERLNALGKPSWERLGVTMRALSADNTLRCVVLRGTGDKAFAAGADIAEFASERADSKQAKIYGSLIHDTLQAVASCRHPTIAMIKGACVGGGLEIAACCDVRICGKSSSFGVPINKLGLTMGYGELAGLLALAGRAVALEILLEGRVFDAAEALQKRLVNRVVPDDQVEPEAYATAQRIAEGAPLVARWHKQFIERLTVQAQIDPNEWDEGFACFDTVDCRAGVDAFLAKKPPQFKAK